jgi:hypothetical protein
VEELGEGPEVCKVKQSQSKAWSQCAPDDPHPMTDNLGPCYDKKAIFKPGAGSHL